MSGKYIVLIILSVLAGIGFIICGIYFLSDKFLQKLNEATDLDEKKKRRNEFRAKGSGYLILGIGALTLVFAIMITVFPEIISALALAYMIILMLGFLGLIVVFK